jgi:crossover junction endodeoxyribonuclease RusA
MRDRVTMLPVTTIQVVGDPAAQGSKRLVRIKSGRTIMLENSLKVRPWRDSIASAAVTHHCPLRAGDCVLYARVRFLRPKGHFRTDGSIKPSAPARPGRLDCDKIARAICDALTGIAWRDDRQVVALAIERVYCAGNQVPGALVQIADAPSTGMWCYEDGDVSDV